MAIVPRSGSDTYFRSRAGRSDEDEAQTAGSPTSAETLEAGAASFFRQRRQADVDAQIAFRAASKANPDTARKANRLAGWTGLPADTIERNLGEVEHGIRADTAAAAMRGNPRLSWWMSQPRNAAAASDDVPTLKSISDQFQAFWGAPKLEAASPGTLWRELTDPAFRAQQARAFQRALTIGTAARAASETKAAEGADGFFSRALAFAKKGVSQLESGLYTVGGAANEWSANHPLPWTSKESIEHDRTAARELRSRAAFLAGAAPIVRGETTWKDVKSAPLSGIVPYVLEQGIQSVPGMVAASVAAPVFVASQAGSIGQQRANNNGRQDADIADVLKAAPAAVVSAALERFGITKIFHAGGSTVTRRILGAAAAEGGTEFLQSGIEYTGGALGTDKGFSVTEALDQSFQGAVAGFGMGGAVRGVHETTASGIRRVVEARQAQAGGAFLDRLMESAATSKLREGDPDAFQAMLTAQAQGTPVENIFVPAEKVRELYQDQGRDWNDPDDDFFGAMAPDFREQMEAGLASGGDVVLPTAAVAARLAGTPEWDAIRNDVRLAPGGMSSNEAAAIEDSWAEEMAARQQAMSADLKAEQEAAAPRQRVFDSVFSMARQSGFSLNAARGYADLWAERYHTRAERLNAGKAVEALTAEHLPDSVLGPVSGALLEAQADPETGTVRVPMTPEEIAALRAHGIEVSDSGVMAEEQAEKLRAERARRVKGGRAKVQADPGLANAYDLFKDSVAGIRTELPGSVQPYQKGDGLDVLVNAMRKGAEAPKPSRPSLVEWLIDRGGVNDAGGDVAAMGGRDVFRGGYFGRAKRPLIRDAAAEGQGSFLGANEGGPRHGLDVTLQDAIAEGYFPELVRDRGIEGGVDSGTYADLPDPSHLLAAIDEELRGNKRYPLEPASAADETQAAIAQAADDLRAMLEARGLDPEKATKKEIAAAIDAYNREQEAERSLDQGQDQQGKRGRIDFLLDGRATITLFEGRDLSTLLHEGGHLWLEELRADALSLTSGKVFGDWETVKAWFKREGVEVGDDGEIPTEAHEMWARGMERYFMEGKAPSTALAGAFASFRAWLLRIYQVVARLDTNITGEVRGVMDRLIATDNAIGWAIHESETRLMFDAKSATDTLGMSGAEFNAYAQLLDDNRTEAFNALLYRTMERIRRSRTKEYRDEEARVRVDVVAEINARPEVRALSMLRGVNGEEYQALDRESVIEIVGKEGVKLIPAGRAGKPSVRAGGMHPDTMAELVGFGDGRALIDALVGIETRRKELVAAGDTRGPIDEAIDLETDRVMADRQPDAFDDGSIEEEALEAIHNDKGSAILAAEVRQLAKAVGEAPTPAEVIKSWATRVVREGGIVDQASGVAVARHQRAEKAAGLAAERAYLAGDMAEAFRQKQKQMVANALYRAAADAKAQVDVIARRLDRLARSRGLKGMDPDYLDRIHELLERYDLRKRPEKDIRERESFEKWAKAQEEKGIEVFIPDRLTMAGNKNFTRLTLEDLTALDDAVQSLAHLGREKAELIVAREKAIFEDVVGEARVNAAGLKMRPWSNDRNPKPRWLNEIDAFMTKIGFLAQQLDGDRPDGIFTRMLVWGAREAANHKAALQKRVLDPVAAAYHAMPKAQQKRLAQRVTVPEFISQNPETMEVLPTTFLRMELVAMALNTGNKSNMEKMLIGETRALPEGLQNQYGWTPEKVMAVLNRELTKEDWDFVQTTWDSVESLWPDLVKSERDITGITPEKVEPRKVETAHGTYAGGYYPVVYDPSRSQRVADNEAETAKSMMGYVGRTVATQKGHTITRIEAAYPLLYSVEHVLFRHVDQVATRIAYAPYLRSALKFIGDERIKKIVVDHAGPEYYKQLKPWLSRQVNEGARDAMELHFLWRILRSARVNATAVGLGFRLTTIAAQPAGLTASVAEIGAAWTARGVNEVRRAPVETFRFVTESSPMMATRAQDFDRDVRLFYSQLSKGTRRDDRTVMGKVAKVNDALHLDAIRGAAFWGIGNMQLHAVDIPTWMGAYLKAIDGGSAIGQARQIADDAVTNTQGGGRAMDLSAIQDSGEGARFLTLFYSWFAVMYNIQRKTVRKVKEGDYRRAATYALWVSLIGPLLSAALTGDTPDDDEDWFVWAFRKIGFGMFASVPVVRDIAAGAERKLTGKFSGASEPPIYRAASEIERPIMDAIRVAKGDDPSERWLRNAITPIGYFTGLPTGQVGTTAQYALDVYEGDQNPDSVGDVVYGVAKGPQKDQE